MIVPNNAEYEETDSNLAQLTILRLHEEIDKLNHIIDKQDRDIVALSNGNRKLKTRIDKAIEHIKKVMQNEEEYEDDYIYNKYLLDILQGSDKE